MSHSPTRRLIATTTAALAACTILTMSSQPAAAGRPVEVAPALSYQAATASPATYLVRWRDTLYRIASRYCGRGSLYPRLAAASGIVNPDRIYAGRTRIVLACGATPTAAPATQPATSNRRVAKVVAYALAQQGKWYRWGSAGPNTFDCSGLTMAAYAQVGIHLNHYSGAQRQQGRAVNLHHLLPGDILWHPDHVVMYVGGGRIVEAPHRGAQVRVRTLRLTEWYGARRIIG